MGGEHSGHHGHAGRPGSVGGSQPKSAAGITTNLNFYEPSRPAPEGYHWATEGEKHLFEEHISKLHPDLLSMYEGEPFTVQVSSDDMVQRMYQGGFITISEGDLYGNFSGIVQHEFLHHIAWQPKVMGDRYLGLRPGRLFDHAVNQSSDRLLQLNEELAMSLSVYDPIPKKWAQQLSRVESWVKAEIAEGKVNEYQRYLKEVGAL